MQSQNIVFTGKNQVEVYDEVVPDPSTSTNHAYWSHLRMGELFFDYVERGDMRVNDLVTHRYAPSDAVEAYRMLHEERATAMGVIFDWTRLQ